MNKTFVGRIALASIVLATGLAASAAHADRDDWGWRGGWRGDWHGGPDWRFHGGGRWYHGDHDGRFGWWWIAGPGLWYFYTQPVYPYPYGPYYYDYPSPPVVVVPSQPAEPAPPPAQQYWYYCDSAKAYYPYVSTCPGGWRKVPATPPDAGQH